MTLKQPIWISDGHLLEELAGVFRRHGYINDYRDVLEIEIGDDNFFPKDILTKGGTRLIPFKIKTKKEVEKKIIEYGKDGQKLQERDSL